MFIVIGILATAVFALAQNFDSSSESSSLTTEPVVETIETEKVESQENSEINSESAPVERITLESRFFYTSTGIELKWNVNQPNEIVSVEISSQENSASILRLGSFDAETNSLELTKNDNEGVTAFSVKATTKSGQQIIAPVLEVRGKFSAN